MSRHTIPDLAQHDLSPRSRLMLYGGEELVLSRVKRQFCQSGLSIDMQRKLMGSRSGRRELCNLVYKAVYGHWRDSGERVRVCQRRARQARFNYRCAVRRENEYLKLRSRYIDNPLAIPVKDTAETVTCVDYPSRMCYRYTAKPSASLYNVVPVTLRAELKPSPFCMKLPVVRKPLATVVKNVEGRFFTVNVYENDMEADKVSVILSR